MRIQWSSSAVQELLDRLAKADSNVEDCLAQVEKVREALALANPDGENQALNKAGERFALLTGRMRAFEETLESYRRAVRISDELFEEAETELKRLAENFSNASGAPIDSGDGGNRAICWTPEAFGVMPEMRTGLPPLPDWLMAVAVESNRIPYME